MADTPELPASPSAASFVPGDLYEDVFYHPCLCVAVDEENDGIWGISLIDGSYPRSTSLLFSVPRKLAVEEAWEMKRKLQKIALPEMPN
ncbi:hypothetical protein [Sphingomonas immobilis]|uniref:Uncharacterized protein n=1 Tax=Sphingomonas immobilis TaxID=3063997 RepID=A0ABT9A0D2_9SPHN|nr:hypothetical protein [Sphingomonas sp. CA1-15]MDO7843282.1 hypothetical protein [Sphingomonas sp. CA1-15]